MDINYFFSKKCFKFSLCGQCTKRTNAAAGDIERTWKTNLSAEQLAAIPHFYMQSGLNYEDMGFIDRMLMKLLAIILRMKKNPSKESEALSRTIEKSFDSSDPKFIIPLVEYLKNA